MDNHRIDINQIPLHQGLEHGVYGNLGDFHSKEYKEFKEGILTQHGFAYERPQDADNLDIAAKILFLIGLGWSCTDKSLNQKLEISKNEFSGFLFSPINGETHVDVLLRCAIFLSMPIAAATVAERWHPTPYALEFYKVTLCTAFLVKKLDLQFEILGTRIADYALETVSANKDALSLIHGKIMSNATISQSEAKSLRRDIYLPDQLAILQKLQ